MAIDWQTEKQIKSDDLQKSATSHAALNATNHIPTDDHYRVIRRNGKATAFDPSKIEVAMTKAFLAVEGNAATASTRIHTDVKRLTDEVVSALIRNRSQGDTFHIEDIQDQVELALMRGSHHQVARTYVLYREQQKQKRISENDVQSKESAQENIIVRYADEERPIDLNKVRQMIEESCFETKYVSVDLIMEEVVRNLYSGMKAEDINSVAVMSARTLTEKEPNYSFVAARLLSVQLWQEALDFLNLRQLEEMAIDKRYQAYFPEYIKQACELSLLDPVLLREFDLDRLAKALLPERDRQFKHLGMQTLYDRYFIHSKEVHFELPQAFFMRVAMGLAANEVNQDERAIEFYRVLSSFDFMSSTPTLFNSATLYPQLSSCYLTTVDDDLHGIFGAMQDNAMLSKFAGGLGNDWTPVRAMGSRIKGTNGKSQGVVPFLKVANDTAVAVNQGGKRKGAVCAYLETWHLDIEEFLDLRKNTGDDRRRTHDMNTANWIPDLFMQRVKDQGKWTLFSPDEVNDLHDLFGKDFEKRYLDYEAATKRGEIKLFKEIDASDLWRKMMNMVYETGHPWLTFKDPCNIRSPQQHTGRVHSSNLCTEITLNTSQTEIAVCNLGSINLAQHVDENGLNVKKLEKTITIAMRMLDNVIERNYYSVKKARDSNLRHRPVGLGIMGFQDALYKMRIPYSDERAVEFADRSMETVSYFAIQASVDLAVERGAYSTFDGSLWSQGILPIDSLNKLAETRQPSTFKVDMSSTLDWDSLRERIKTEGIRNSNTMAIAPTATISNICGITQSIEPTYQNLFVKSNLSGEFTVVNTYLCDDLRKQNLWDEVMVNDLKYYDGSIGQIDRIPAELKELYATAFEVDPRWLVEAASRRQKWIDQSQSLNLYMADPSGKKLSNLYQLAWVRGLKTTYYLRSIAATHVEKSTIDHSGSNLNAVSVDSNVSQASMCTLDEDCEACQ